MVVRLPFVLTTLFKNILGLFFPAVFSFPNLGEYIWHFNLNPDELRKRNTCNLLEYLLFRMNIYRHK